MDRMRHHGPVRDRQVALLAATTGSRPTCRSSSTPTPVWSWPRARPVPGTTAGAQAWRASGLAAHCQGVTLLGDGAYIGCRPAVLHRKRPDRPLFPVQEEDNAEHCRVRVRIEHAFARMKNYKTLRGCRHAAAAFTTPSKPSPTCTTSPWPHDPARTHERPEPARSQPSATSFRAAGIAHVGSPVPTPARTPPGSARPRSGRCCSSPRGSRCRPLHRS